MFVVKCLRAVKLAIMDTLMDFKHSEIPAEPFATSFEFGGVQITVTIQCENKHDAQTNRQRSHHQGD